MFTFYANDVVPYLLGYNTIGHHFYEIVNGVYRRMDALEPLNLLSYRQGIVEEGLKVRPGAHLGHVLFVHLQNITPYLISHENVADSHSDSTSKHSLQFHHCNKIYVFKTCAIEMSSKFQLKFRQNRQLNKQTSVQYEKSRFICKILEKNKQIRNISMAQ